MTVEPSKAFGADRLDGLDFWAGFYRSNPARFAEDYLHLELHVFQKILLTLMNIGAIFCFIGARGVGKSFLSAVFCVVRCILYPGTQICVASGTRGQAFNVLEKILLELKPNSPELANEIDEKQTQLNGTNAKIVFRNGSYIKVVTASDTARGNRATTLILDEFRLIAKDVIDTILRKFLTQRRMPKYADLPKEDRKAEYAKERNKTLYLSSAYFADHWSFTKCTDTCRFMLDDRRNDFVCGFPYQLSIYEGLLDPNTVEEEMAESDFSEIKWSMEMDALFWGGDGGSFFDFNSISKNRKAKYAMLPDRLSSKLKSGNGFRIPAKLNGEKRILSADIALMASGKHKNDAAAIFINQMIPSSAGRYSKNIVYCDTAEGLHTADQALMIRRLFDEYQCDYLSLDIVGIGLGVFDALIRDIVDPETGKLYPSLSVCNDAALAEQRCIKGAEKAIWVIRGNQQFNSDCAVLLREGFKSGKIRLLTNEYDAEKLLDDIGGYKSLSPQEQLKIQMPYIQTTLLVDELVKLQHDDSSGKVRVFERSGMRKDRYSSLSYNYYVAIQLESKLTRRASSGSGTEERFMYRAPKIK
jgi:hypothetical protein